MPNTQGEQSEAESRREPSKLHVLVNHAVWAADVNLLGVFTDANLERAATYVDMFGDDGSLRIETVQIDDPRDIAALDEHIREFDDQVWEFAELRNRDEPVLEVPRGGRQGNPG
jgi:hypothetical protein